jgi:hypothetical protein
VHRQKKYLYFKKKNRFLHYFIEIR